MVQPTFERLSEDKQQLVRDALLKEFSQYPLTQAQVARIVKTAGIARGAFYTYFADLTDAYQYLFNHVLTQVHAGLPMDGQMARPDQYVETIREFFTEANHLNYLQLFRMHYQYNEYALGAGPSPLKSGVEGAKQWAILTLYHQAVRDIILDPDHLEQRLVLLQKVLTMKGE